eukprot:SAG11_NODE_3520_length_2396_cov_1.235960_2_plen_98_part_00
MIVMASTDLADHVGSEIKHGTECFPICQCHRFLLPRIRPCQLTRAMTRGTRNTLNQAQHVGIRAKQEAIRDDWQLYYTVVDGLCTRYPKRVRVQILP